MEEIYKLKLNESIEYIEHDINTRILRVAGGWVYTVFNRGNDMGSSCFVPFDNEFLKWYNYTYQTNKHLK